MDEENREERKQGGRKENIMWERGRRGEGTWKKGWEGEDDEGEGECDKNVEKGNKEKGNRRK